MAMTLRLSPSEDQTLERLARAFRTSKNVAAAKAIDIATPRPNHTEFVRTTTARLLARYDTVMQRLSEA